MLIIEDLHKNGASHLAASKVQNFSFIQWNLADLTIFTENLDCH